jgi:hypothetical protein
VYPWQLQKFFRLYFTLISPLFPHYHDLDAVALHGLPGADFCGLAAFRLTIDSDFALSNQMFALSAAVGNAGEFQQIAKPDMFIFQLKLAGFHWVPVVGASSTDDGAMILELHEYESAGNTAPAPHSKSIWILEASCYKFTLS